MVLGQRNREMVKVKAVIVACFFLSCAFPIGAQRTRTATLTNDSTQLIRLVETYFDERLQLFPLEATAMGDTHYNDQLPDSLSKAHRVRVRALYTKYLTRLKNIRPQYLNPQDRITYETFKYEMETKLLGLQFPDLLPITQIDGLQLGFAQLGGGTSIQPFKTVKDYDNFLKRIGGFIAWTNSAITNTRKGLRTGIVQPRVLMERVLSQCDELLTKDVQQSVFYQPIKNMPANFSAADKMRLAAAYNEAIRNRILPTYKKLHDFIETEYLPKSRSTAGLSAVPTGRKRYNYLVKYWTTTDLTADAIHQIGLGEVNHISAEMERIKLEVGFKGDLISFFQFLRTDPRFRPFNTAAEVLDAYRQIETRVQTNLPKYFGILPKSKFEVRETEKFRERSATEEYKEPSSDGSRPGIFYVPISEPKEYSLLNMECTFLHEAIPGHHFQVSIQQENKSLPRFRKYLWYGAFGEGWALYTESLGKELGIYSDPYQYFGMLNADMHRALRLVIDTGIHSKGWTREQAIKFSMEHEAMSEEYIVTEIERYMADPGQALSYKIGQMKILELRHQAERVLGEKFDIRAFHDETLRDGVLPLNLYEFKMNQWLVQQQQKSSVRFNSPAVDQRKD